MVVLAGLLGLACHNWGGNGRLVMEGETPDYRGREVVEASMLYVRRS